MRRGVFNGSKEGYGKGYDDGNRKRNQVKAEEYRKDWRSRYRADGPDKARELGAVREGAKKKGRTDGMSRGD